jgi:hypothetical protein
VIPGIGKTIPVFNLASNHQWNVTLSDLITLMLHKLKRFTGAPYATSFKADDMDPQPT